VAWQKELKELALRQALAQRMGGEDKVWRHRAQGRMPVRERIAKLLDAESFREVGALAAKSTDVPS